MGIGRDSMLGINCEYLKEAYIITCAEMMLNNINKEEVRSIITKEEKEYLLKTIKRIEKRLNTIEVIDND